VEKMMQNVLAELWWSFFGLWLVDFWVSCASNLVGDVAFYSSTDWSKTYTQIIYG
jgi:hypothetical protein